MTRDETPQPAPENCVGVFDSGLGGLSIVREILRELPREKVVFFADNLHMPYGPRPLGEVRELSMRIASGLLRIPAKAVVAACNTASAAALKELRLAYPGRLFVGMEPAVKPAAEESRSGRVGVLATGATFQGELFASVVERFAAGVEVVRQPCPGLAECVESHPPGHPALAAMIRRFLRPLLDRGVDQIVLGCTHYPLVKDMIADAAGPGVRVVDPSPAVARRVRQVLAGAGLLAGGGGGLTLGVSGETEEFSRNASLYLGKEVRAERCALAEIAEYYRNF